MESRDAIGRTSRRWPSVRWSVWWAVLIVGAGMPSSSVAATDLPGPVVADVIRIVDGDTLRVRVNVWIDQELEVWVRIRGIDAPELRGSCASERSRARRARAYLAAATSGGPVTLTNISGGKYFGRVLADVSSVEGNDMAGALMRNHLAAPYAARRTSTWC